MAYRILNFLTYYTADSYKTLEKFWLATRNLQITPSLEIVRSLWRISI